MSHAASAEHAHGKVGMLLHSPRFYDFIVNVLTLGREARLRRTMLQRAGVAPGQTILDIGCGTGTLAIAAKQLAGPTAIVHGLEAAPEMLARAQAKAARAGVDVQFRQGAAQSLPFSEGQFDLVMATLMLHHVPHAARPRVYLEVSRILKPKGRFFIADFVKAPDAKRHVLHHFHRHNFLDFSETAASLKAAGLAVVDSGPLKLKDLHYLVANRA